MSLTATLTVHQVRAKVAVADWRAAVAVVGERLVATGACNDSYVAAMQQAVLDLGPYMVVAPGVAMPHARPEAGAQAPGMAIATLATPVEFGHATNDPVDLVIGFTALDKDAHLERLQDIVAFLQDDQRVTAVRAATTTDQLYAALS